LLAAAHPHIAPPHPSERRHEAEPDGSAERTVEPIYAKVADAAAQADRDDQQVLRRPVHGDHITRIKIAR